MNIAFSLKTARAEKNLTQTELAYVADVSQVTLSHIENGKVRPNPSTKEKIEKILGPVDWRKTFDEGRVKRQIIKN